MQASCQRELRPPGRGGRATPLPGECHFGRISCGQRSFIQEQFGRWVMSEVSTGAAMASKSHFTRDLVTDVGSLNQLQAFVQRKREGEALDGFCLLLATEEQTATSGCW